MESRNNNREQMNMAVSEKKKASDYKWAKENMTIVGVRVRNTLKEEFRAVCEQNGTTMNAVLLKALHDYMGEAEQTSPAPLPTPPSGWAEQKPSVLRTFRTTDGWQLDIDDDGTAYGAWLSHSSSDAKMHIFSAVKSRHELAEFIGLVFSELDEQKETYRAEFM